MMILALMGERPRRARDLVERLSRTGGLVDETYPSGRVVRNALDANGDLAVVESKKNSTAGFWQYANSITYTPSGAVASLQLGNGRWEYSHLNSRLQPDKIYLGTTPGGYDKLKLDFDYGSTNNNGNVLSQTITVPGLAQPFIQTYTYDELNRLASATETNNGSTTMRRVTRPATVQRRLRMMQKTSKLP